VLLPLWLAAGHADYRIHRHVGIERTSGTHESLTHVLMVATTGVGVAGSMFFEETELVLAVQIASALAHEAIVVWDFGYAVKRRPPGALEQHVHSLLEVLPFAGLAFNLCLNPRPLARLAGRGEHPPDFRLKLRRDPRAVPYDAAVIVAVTALLIVPFAEEFVRCWRVDHTVAPHPVPPAVDR
jgi:hypothetical protein